MSYDVVLVMTWTPSSDSGDVAFECNKHWFSSCDDNNDQEYSNWLRLLKIKIT